MLPLQLMKALQAKKARIAMRKAMKAMKAMQPTKAKKAMDGAYKATIGMAAAMTAMKNIKALKAKKAKAPYEALLAPLIELLRVREMLRAVTSARGPPPNIYLRTWSGMSLWPRSMSIGNVSRSSEKPRTMPMCKKLSV